MSDYIKQLEDLKEKAQKNREEKIKLEQQLKTMADQKAKLLEELVPLKVTQENLPAAIKELEQQIEEELEELTGIING